MSNLPMFNAYMKFRRELAQLASLRLKKVRIGLKQASILGHLSLNERATLGELTEATMSDPAATSRAVASMEKAGLLKKATDPVDTRKLVIELTTAGKKKAAITMGVRASMFEEIKKTMSHSELAELSRLLEKAADSLRDTRTEA